jgi:hypothetical protein
VVRAWGESNVLITSYNSLFYSLGKVSLFLTSGSVDQLALVNKQMSLMKKPKVFITKKIVLIIQQMEMCR